jgi:hypothetical protein
MKGPLHDPALLQPEEVLQVSTGKASVKRMDGSCITNDLVNIIK